MKRTNLFFTILILGLASCKKKDADGGGQPPPPVNPVDPPAAATMGFFLNDWEPKSFSFPAYEDVAPPTSAVTSFVSIDAANIITKIPKSIFGHNANSWMTQIVTEPVLVQHLTRLKPNIIRFPGGSISDLYFWNALPNQKPADVPDSLIDASGNMIPGGYWFGRNNQGWTISVDNYYHLLQQTGSQGMITINYGYARYGTGPDPVARAAHLAAEWVRYDNGRTKYWEIGNESNGTWEAGYRINTATNQDGQPAIITGAIYGQHFKVFADSMKKAAQEIGKTIYIGAYLLEKQPESWQTPTDQSWNQGVLTQSANKADFYVIHSYYTPFQQNVSADVILNSALNNTGAMMNYVKTSITNNGAVLKPVAMTEWNIFAEGSLQQVSFINGMHATILLGESLKHQYGQTSRWDLANGWNNGNDHGLFNIGDEPGVSKWNPRPAFYYMYFFQRMSGDRLLASTVTGSVLAYASSFSSGQKAVVLVNRGNTAQTVNISLQNATAGERYYWYTLTGGTDNGEFSGKVAVNGKGPTEASGGPAHDYHNIKAYSASTQSGIRVAMPARSAVYLVIDKG